MGWIFHRPVPAHRPEDLFLTGPSAEKEEAGLRAPLPLNLSRHGDLPDRPAGRRAEANGNPFKCDCPDMDRLLHIVSPSDSGIGMLSTEPGPRWWSSLNTTLDAIPAPWPKRPKRHRHMIRRLYDWTLSLARSRHALLALALVAFAESSVFPVPPDILMIPMILAMPSRAFVFAAVCLVASVAGGLFGYFIGYGLLESIGRPVLELYGREAHFEDFSQRYNEWGAWAVLFAGVTPFPYKVIAIVSGATALHLPVFIVASVIARGLRFFIVAALLWKFGTPIREFIERRLGLMFTLFAILLLGGILLAGYA